VYIFCVEDKHHDTCPKSFQLQNYSYFTSELHSNKEKHIGQILCTVNYSTHDGLVNGVDGIFQALSKLLNSPKVIWILFNNFKSGQLT
jgi:hypothetical protein